MTSRLNLIALATLAACGPLAFSPGPSVLFTADREAYRPGDSITVTLTNRTDAEIGYNLCPTALDARRGGEWVEADPLAEICTMELRILAPGAADSFPHRLPPALEPGEYRVRVRIERPLGGDWTAVASEGFRVAAEG